MTKLKALQRGAFLFVLGCGAALAALPTEQEPAAAPSADPEMVVPAGTSIPISLSTFLNSRSSQVGDNFYADTTYPIWIQQRQVIPRGSVIKGTVTQVVRPGRVKGKARIAIKFESVLLPNGVLRELVADLKGIHGPGTEKIDPKTETVEMDGSKGRDAGEVGGQASTGAIIGAIAGGGKGALIGAGAGSAVGLATVFFSRGKELVLEPGTQFDLVLMQPLRFAYGELQFSQAELNSADRVTRPRPGNRQDRDRPTYFPGRIGLPFPMSPL
jgi:type IV secretion system protein VirB10